MEFTVWSKHTKLHLRKNHNFIKFDGCGSDSLRYEL